MKGSYKICEKAITSIADMARIISKIQIYFTTKDKFPIVLNILFNYPHSYNLTALLSTIINNPPGFSQPLLSVEDTIDNSSHPNQSKTESIIDMKSFEADNQSSCFVLLSNPKSDIFKKPVEQELIKKIANYINQSCTYYLLEEIPINGANISSDDSNTFILTYQKAMLEAFKDALFQLHDGFGPSFYQTAVVTNNFSAIFNSHQVILTRISPYFRKLMNECQTLEYSSLYDNNILYKEMAKNEPNEYTDWKRSWIPGFSEKGKQFTDALNLKSQNLTIIGCAYFSGKAQVNELMKFLINILKTDIKHIKEKRTSSFHIKLILSNFPVANCNLRIIKTSMMRFNQTNTKTEKEKINCLELSGHILPCSIGLILKTLTQLCNIQILNEISFNLTFDEHFDPLFYPEDLIALPNKPIWLHWRQFSSNVALLNLNIFRRFERLVPKFSRKFTFDDKQVTSQALVLLPSENTSITPFPKNSFLTDNSEESVLGEFPTSQSILCTDFKSLELRPFSNMANCTKISLEIFDKFSIKFPEIIAKQLPYIRFCFRFFTLPNSRLANEENTVYDISSIRIHQLVSPVWDRYVYNFNKTPPTDDFIPMLRPSWIGLMKMSIRKAVVPDNSVYVIWIGNQFKPNDDEIAYRIALRIGMTTRPVELMRTDRFHDDVMGVKRSLELWISNLETTHTHFPSQVFPLKIRIYGVITTDLETEQPSDYMKNCISQLMNLNSLLKSNNLIAIETYLVKPHWLYECYHKASIESGNEKDFILELNNDFFNESRSSFRDKYNPSISFRSFSEYLKLHHTNLPLWGWIIIIIENSYNEKDRNFLNQYLKLYHGINSSFVNSLCTQKIAIEIKEHLKKSKIPYKQIQTENTIRLSIAIISDEIFNKDYPFLEIFIDKKKLIVPGYNGIPILSFDWLMKILEYKSQITMDEFHDCSSSNLNKITQKIIFENKNEVTKIVPYKKYSENESKENSLNDYNQNYFVNDNMTNIVIQHDQSSNCTIQNEQVVTHHLENISIPQAEILSNIKDINEELLNLNTFIEKNTPNSKKRKTNNRFSKSSGTLKSLKQYNLRSKN